MLRTRSARWITFALITATPTVYAQTAAPAAPLSLHDRILDAANLSAIEDVDARPWHLMLEVTAFDDKGANPQQGTVELWQSGSDRRVAYTFGARTRSELHTATGFYVSQTGDDIPFAAEDALQRFLRVGPTVQEIDGSTPELRKQTLNKIPFDCIMLDQHITGVPFAPLGLFPTYCMVHDTNEIRLTYDFSSQATLLRRTGKFLDRIVPTELSISNGTTQFAIAKVTTLATFVPSAADFTPTAGMKQLGVALGTARLAGGVMAGRIISKTIPVYPDDAKQRHVSGTVILHAIIGRDGHIHSLRPVTTVDPSLALSAVDAVRRWTYKPYLLNGVPTEVDTTITVNFNLGS